MANNLHSYTYFSRLFKLFSFYKMKHLNTSCILSIRDFHHLIENQYMRSLRNNLTFSLICIRSEDKNLKKLIDHILLYVRKRKRKSDEVGWLDEQAIGIFLPDTNYLGAETFTLHFLIQENGQHVNLETEIYTFPDHWFHEYETKILAPWYIQIFKDNRSRNLIDRPIWKRGIDITVTFFACILLTPTFILIASYIKCVSKGPILFKQQRIGYLGRSFTCYKFRSMHTFVNPEKHKNHVAQIIANNTQWNKLDDDPDSGVIPGGNIIRKLGLDELPQFINILRGEMSLIGPRPCLPYEAESLKKWQHQRFHIYPGMSGWWQVNGKNRTTFLQMLRYDVHYSSKYSILMDLKIIFMTFPAIIKQAMGNIHRRKVDYVKNN